MQGSIWSAFASWVDPIARAGSFHLWSQILTSLCLHSIPSEPATRDVLLSKGIQELDLLCSYPDRSHHPILPRWPQWLPSFLIGLCPWQLSSSIVVRIRPWKPWSDFPPRASITQSKIQTQSFRIPFAFWSHTRRLQLRQSPSHAVGTLPPKNLHANLFTSSRADSHVTWWEPFPSCLIWHSSPLPHCTLFPRVHLLNV